MSTADDRKQVVGPETVGVDSRRLEILIDRIRLEVDGGSLPSVQFAVARHGDLVAFETLGDPGVDVAEPRYVLQSAGRTYVASAAWKLLGEGKLGLDERVADVIPEFGTNGKEEVTVEQVLTHTGGFPFAPLGYPKMVERESRVAAFAKWRADEPPGKTLQWHLTAAAWLIDEMVFRRAGVSLPEYLRTEVAGPLGLGLDLGVSIEEQERTVAPMRCTDGDGSQVDPWGPWFLNNREVVAAGEPSHSLVGSASDVALHYQALLAALEGRDNRVWTADAVAQGIAPRVTAVPAGDPTYGGGTRLTSVGLFVLVAGEAGTPNLPEAGSERVFGNSGAAYQVGFADPETGLSFALLSNGYPTAGYDKTQSGRAMLVNVSNLAADLLAPAAGSSDE